MPLGLAKLLGDLDDATFDASEDARRREAPAGVALARWHTGQDLDPLRCRVDGVEMKGALREALRHVIAQHQMRQVRPRNEDALCAGQAPRLAQVEEALDLRAPPADGLHLAQ